MILYMLGESTGAQWLQYLIVHTSSLVNLLCLIRLTPLAMELSSDIARISNQGGLKKSQEGPVLASLNRIKIVYYVKMYLDSHANHV